MQIAAHPARTCRTCLIFLEEMNEYVQLIQRFELIEPSE